VSDWFELNPQLAGDTHLLIDLPLSRVLLMNDKRFPWIILVPRCVDITEFYQLSQTQCSQLVDEIKLVSKALVHLFEPHKLNVAALGNMVAQFHVHIIARYRHDVAWPSPVFGVSGAQMYDEHEVRVLREQVTQMLG
jgi:diadenosine tetraphosphate (Ap4A) HIT family hydrolase